MKEAPTKTASCGNYALPYFFLKEREMHAL
jgi:hypothetical protein